MAFGTLKQIPEDFVNRLSFHIDSEDEEDMLADASPCKSSRMSSVTSSSSTSSLPLPSFLYKSRQKRSAFNFGGLEMPSPLFKASFGHKSTDSVQSVDSVGSMASLTQTSSSELDSEIEFGLAYPGYTTPDGNNDASNVTMQGDATQEDTDEGDTTKEDITPDQLPSLSPAGLFDDFEMETTPVGRSSLLRSSRYHRVNHSTIGIPSSMFTARSQGRCNSAAKSLSQTTMEGRVPPRPPPIWMPSPKVRRTQSMFATPEQMLHDLNPDISTKGVVSTSTINVDGFGGVSLLDSPQCPVPTFKVRQDPFPRISAETLCRLMDREFESIYAEIVVIDCRFEYEFEGGHIDGAINVNSKQQLERTLFHHRSRQEDQRVLLVFHCEHSAYRSPMLASHLRHCDRDANASRYPSLFYPDVAVLNGGYSEFYMTAAQRCVPQNYVGMNHQEHQRTCEREMSRFRLGMKSRKFPSMGMVSAPDLTSFRFPSKIPGESAPTEASGAIENLEGRPGPAARTVTFPKPGSLFDL